MFVSQNCRKEDIALLICDEWKNRLHTCKNDFTSLIKEKSLIVEKFMDKEDYEKADKEIIEIDKLNSFIEEIKEIFKKYDYYPIPILVVERIQFFEKEIYMRYMTPEIMDKLKKKEEDRRKFFQTSQELVSKVDEMWDNNLSEQEIKDFIYNQIKLLFPYNSEETNVFLTDNLFITLTAGKNVRVALSEQDINNLKRENGRNGTCGTCLEEYKENDEMIVLKCGHVYHEDCIVPWLKMSVHCPTCRQDLRN